jgi:hypothetical protein
MRMSTIVTGMAAAVAVTLVGACSGGDARDPDPLSTTGSELETAAPARVVPTAPIVEPMRFGDAQGRRQVTTAPAPADVGTPVAGCSRGQTLGSSAGAALGADIVEKYSCATCQTGGGATSADSASLGNGLVVATPAIELIFWGTAWQSGTAVPSAAQLTQAMNNIAASAYFDGLKQYGVTNVRLDQVQIVNDNPPNPFALSDVENRIAALIYSGFFSNNVLLNTIFIVMMPPGSNGPSSFCGSHGVGSASFRFQSFPLFVGWSGFDDLDSMTAVATHEIVETATDPGSNGWLMDRNFAGGSGQNEIGDACNNQQDFSDTTMVQAYWSNTDRACIIPYARPTVTAMTPPNGPTGTGVTFAGTHLGGGTPSATFGSATASSVACTSSTRCTATVPAGTGVVPVSVLTNYTSVCPAGPPSSGETCEPFAYPCVPETTAVACAGAPCGHQVTDGCGGLITCPSLCPSGQICSDATNNTCCTPPVPGESLPNQCPPICPVCPLGYVCQVGVGEARGVCVVNQRCPVGSHFCNGACIKGTGICPP